MNCLHSCREPLIHMQIPTHAQVSNAFFTPTNTTHILSTFKQKNAIFLNISMYMACSLSQGHLFLSSFIISTFTG